MIVARGLGSELVPDGPGRGPVAAYLRPEVVSYVILSTPEPVTHQVAPAPWLVFIMVRLGKVTPKLWEDLEQQGVNQDAIEEAAAAAAEAAKEKAAQLAKEALSEVRVSVSLSKWPAPALSDAIGRAHRLPTSTGRRRRMQRRRLARSMRSVGCRSRGPSGHGGLWPSGDAAVNAAYWCLTITVAAACEQKYGIFKNIVMSAWFKKLMGVWDKIRAIQLLGEPRMAPAAIIILLFMLLRAKQPTHVLVLFAAFFYNVHPVLIVGVSGFLWLWARVRKPKGFRAAAVKATPAGIIDEVGR